MKKLAVLIIAGFLSFTACAQQGYQQDLNHIASITFPATPQVKSSKGQTLYALNNQGIVYLATVSEIHENLVELSKKNLDDSMFSGVITGSLNSFNGRLLYKKSTFMNGLRGIEFCDQADIKGENYFCYYQTFHLNNTLVLYGYWSKDSLKSDDKGLRSFFGSFKLKVKIDTRDQNRTSELNFKIGELIGFFGCMAVVVLGVFFIVKKTTSG